MKKVLHIVSSMNRGGLETFIMNVYRVINRNKIQFDFLVTSEKNDFADEIKKLGGEIYYISPRNRGLVKYRKNVLSFFNAHKNEYIAVHQHSSSLTSIFPLEVAEKTGVKTRIIHSHNSKIKGSKLHYLIHYYNKLRIGKIATHFFACSDWMCCVTVFVYLSKVSIYFPLSGLKSYLKGVFFTFLHIFYIQK